jgi:hypothetical protein
MTRSVAITGGGDSRPAGRRNVASRAADTDSSPRRPARPARTEPSASHGGRGFGAYKQTVQENRQDYASLKVEDETLAVAFLEDEPFDHVLRHWVNKKPRNCIGDDCPLCERSIPAKPVLLFNVVDMAKPDKVLLWEASADPAKRIEKRYDDLAKKNKHLNDEGVYFEVSKFKKDNNVYEYVVDKLAESDLVDDWGLEPLTDDDRAALAEDLYDASIIRKSTRAELIEFLDEQGD